MSMFLHKITPEVSVAEKNRPTAIWHTDLEHDFPDTPREVLVYARYNHWFITRERVKLGWYCERGKKWIVDGRFNLKEEPSCEVLAWTERPKVPEGL